MTNRERGRTARRALGSWGSIFPIAAIAAGSLGCTDDDPVPPHEEVCLEEAGVACVWAGTGALGANGDFKDRLDTMLYWPIDMAFAPDGTPWVLDWNNHQVRRVLPDGTFETMVGTFLGDGPPDQSDLTAPGAPGLTVALNHPTDIAFADNDTLLFAAWHNHKIRQLDIPSGNVIVKYGRGAGFAGDEALAEGAERFNQPKAIDFDAEGRLYILDQRNFRIRRVDTDGTITTVVGTGEAGFGGDGGAPDAAQVKFEAGGNPEPSGAIACGPDGTLFISDGLNHRIRKVDFDAGTIETVAGTGEPGYGGDGGPAKDAQIDNVRDLELGPDGKLYFADTENHRIRAIDLETGTIETVAGTGEPGNASFGKPALEAQLNRPFGIAFDQAGSLFISDTFNSWIVKIPGLAGE